MTIKDNLSRLQLPHSFLLLINRKLLQSLEAHALQRPLICSRQHDLRNLLVVVARPVLERLLPATHAETPFAAALETDVA